MKNIFRIYKRDLQNILRNAMAMIVIIGITVIPSLYAWFNIAANWDPYGSTDGIKVAVANNDTGASLDGIDINLGEQIVNNLATNNQIGWEFVDEDDAVGGTQSGKYYAAIVIPEDFSSCISSVLTSEIKRPKIVYYSNEKKNAIAPKITDKGASSIQSQVNTTFISQVTEIADKLLNSTLSQVTEDGNNIIDSLLSLLDESKSNLIITNNAITAFGDTVDSLSGLIDTVDSAVPDTQKIADESSNALEDLKDLTTSCNNSIDCIASSISSITSSARKTGDTINSLLDDAYSLAETDINAAIDKLNQANALCSTVYEMNSNVANTLYTINNSLPVPLTAINDLIDKINSNNQKIQNLMSKISESISFIRTNKEMGADIKNQLQSLESEINNELDTIKNTYTDDIRPQMKNLTSDLYQTIDDTQSLLATVSATSPDLSATLGKLKDSLETSKNALSSTTKIIASVEDKIDTTITKIKDLENNKQLKQLLTILKNDPEVLSQFMASPVQIDTEKVYPIENYGSAMAPFYSTLAIWVGGIVLVAILKVNVKKKETLGNIKPYQEYFGRYLLFFTIGFLQTTIICLGDLFFLGIQCVEPFWFLVAGWVSCFVYTLIIYTLTSAFSDVGKALAVILLVIQIGGSNGTFPIECTPQFFQNVYPFLPFTYTINAMRECVAGMYGTTFVTDILYLLAFVPFTLLLGLLLRKPLINVKKFFEKRLKDSDVM